jgi:hypothetical protein
MEPVYIGLPEKSSVPVRFTAVVQYEDLRSCVSELTLAGANILSIVTSPEKLNPKRISMKPPFTVEYEHFEEVCWWVQLLFDPTGTSFVGFPLCLHVEHCLPP